MDRFYEAETEAAMKRVYDRFSEKDKRLYAAIEVKKLPYGGFSYISNILDCSAPTLCEGLKELEALEELPKDRVRRPGGGRKRIIEITDQIDSVFLTVVGEHTAGDPMNEELIWTDLTPSQIAELMKGRGLEVSPYVVEQLLEKHGYSRRAALKNISTGTSENRDEQFKNIERLKEEYRQQGNPIISMDAKKKSF
ncbi:hypothetical protein WDW89_04610 [Deltaproteobacteria bacterium TL4]